MQLKKIQEIFERFAPLRYSDELVRATDGYDNSGLLLKNGSEIRRAVFALDFSEKAVAFAVEKKADLIVTHHPAIYRGVLSVSDETPFGRAFLSAAKNGISVYSMHLNLDVAEEGIDANLASIFGKNTRILIPLEVGVGYGRLTEVAPVTLKNLATKYKKATGSSRVAVYGNPDRIVERVASFCGGGSGAEELALAVKNNADVMVSADFPHHILAEAVARGIAVLNVTHYSSEIYGFRAFYEFIINHLGGLPTDFFVDEALL